MVEILKTAIEQTTSRAKARGGRLKHIPALALPLITSNSEMPNDDALRRRMHTLHYTYGEQRQEKDIKAFEEEFRINKGGKNELTNLKTLGYFTINLVKKNPELLDIEWQAFGDRLIKEIYEYANELQPSWLNDWAKAETLEDLREDRVEEVREILLEEINDARVRFWKTTDSTDGMLETFANDGKIPWLAPHNIKNVGPGYAMGNGFVRIFNKKLGRVETLKGIGEILGWTYGASRTGTSGMNIIVSEETLELFLFPNYRRDSDTSQVEL